MGKSECGYKKAAKGSPVMMVELSILIVVMFTLVTNLHRAIHSHTYTQMSTDKTVKIYISSLYYINVNFPEATLQATLCTSIFSWG